MDADGFQGMLGAKLVEALVELEVPVLVDLADLARVGAIFTF